MIIKLIKTLPIFLWNFGIMYYRVFKCVNSRSVDPPSVSSIQLQSICSRTGNVPSIRSSSLHALNRNDSPHIRKIHLSTPLFALFQIQHFLADAVFSYLTYGNLSHVHDNES